MNVLVVEDDVSLGDFLLRVLTEEGDQASWVESLAAAREALADPAQRFDVIVLDWMLPDEDGVTLCAELRARGDATPVLLLTARGDVPDRVTGLRSGADDYLVKPFDVEELLARLQALVRRSLLGTRLKVGVLEIDSIGQRASVAGRSLELTAKELALLTRLARGGEQAVERATLLADVWQLHFDPGSGLLDVHVSRLRDKLGAHSWMIETVRGLGYRLRSARGA
jgi:DNA-binding response OmpR family regulator